MAISPTGGARPKPAGTASRRGFFLSDSRKERCRRVGDRRMSVFAQAAVP
jgi:hypothetical protein